MKVLLANPPWETAFGYGIRSNSRWPHVRPDKHLQFPIYLAYTAALLEREGHEVCVIDAVAEELKAQGFLERIRSYSPEKVFLGTSTPTLDQDLGNARAIREAGFPVYVFGTHVSAFDEQVITQNRFLDGIVRNEFETIVADVCSDRPKEEISGLTFTDPDTASVVRNPDAPMIEDLDTLPFPNREHFDSKQYEIHLDPTPNALLVASRGCSFQCTYCIWPQTLYGHLHRRRSPKNICDELELLIQNYQIRFFRFDDDLFTLNAKAVIEFCQEFMGRGLHHRLKWVCFGHVNTGTEEMFRLMAEAGCVRIDMGVESGSEKILKLIKKGINLQKAKETFDLCRKYGIQTYADYMIGFPHETREDIEETIRSAVYLDPDLIQVSFAIPIPGTEMYSRGIDEGYIDSAIPFDEYDATGGVCDTGDISKEELQQWYYTFWKRFYLRPAFLFRQMKRVMSSWEEARLVMRGAFSFFKRVYIRQ